MPPAQSPPFKFPDYSTAYPCLSCVLHILQFSLPSPSSWLPHQNLMSSANYEAPHYDIFTILLSFPLPILIWLRNSLDFLSVCCVLCNPQYILTIWKTKILPLHEMLKCETENTSNISIYQFIRVSLIFY